MRTPSPLNKMTRDIDVKKGYKPRSTLKASRNGSSLYNSISSAIKYRQRYSVPTIFTKFKEKLKFPTHARF